ncbi:MAG: hypothetical protein ACXQS7_04075 [Candidatus Syntropharchaeia archaeon]
MTEKTEDLRRYFKIGVFIILMFLLLVATFQFYFSVMDALSSFFDYRYRSIVQAGFALCVIVITILLLRDVVR